MTFLLIVSISNVVGDTLMASKNIVSSGSLTYPDGVFTADFESDASFKWGVDGTGDYMLYNNYVNSTSPSIWTRGAWPAFQYPGKLIFQPEFNIVYSGNQAAEITVADTSLESSRRLEILHDWDPFSTDVWSVGWFYFPSSLKPLDSWVTFDRLIYERMWAQNKAVYYQYFQISLSAMTDT
ncbi:MAG: hypothetical protein NTV61_04890, partial [Candidatus Bathyarchaeota archaeon]|nr:hypothetical protein [Candidatus Bathyarchaeota archaeon]